MDERAKQSLDAIRRLLDRTTPWLSEIGSWIFGGLVAVNFVLISALLTVGPVDSAVRISVTLFACALPMDVAGIVVLRLTKDLMDFGVDDLALQAFKESGFPEIDAYLPPARFVLHVCLHWAHDVTGSIVRRAAHHYLLSDRSCARSQADARSGRGAAPAEDFEPGVGFLDTGPHQTPKGRFHEEPPPPPPVSGPRTRKMSLDAQEFGQPFWVPALRKQVEG